MNLSGIAKRMILVVCGALLVLVAGSIVYYRSFEFLPFAFGALLGTVLNIIKIVMIDRTVKRAVDPGSKIAANAVLIQQLLKFALTGLVLVLAATIPFISLWGAVFGILTFHVAAWSLKSYPGSGEDAADSAEHDKSSD